MLAPGDQGRRRELGDGTGRKAGETALFVGCAFHFVNLNCNVIEVIHADTWEVKLCHEAPKLLPSLSGLPSLIVSSETNPSLLAAAQAVHSAVQEFIRFYLCPSPPPARTSPVRKPFWFKYIFSLYILKSRKYSHLRTPRAYVATFPCTTSCTVFSYKLLLYGSFFELLLAPFLIRQSHAALLSLFSGTSGVVASSVVDLLPPSPLSPGLSPPGPSGFRSCPGRVSRSPSF